MDNPKKRKVPFLVWELLILVVVVGVLFYQYKFVDKQTVSYEKTKETLSNPMMGFVAVADNVELAKTTNLVYLPVVWSQFEPEEGYYDFQSLRDTYHLDLWKSQGKQVVLRFICDIPDEEGIMDIPQWLYDKTGDGTHYDITYGKGYSPDYSNQTFIEYHKKAISALGKEFQNEEFVCFIQLGSLGHWGEWHVKSGEGIVPLPPEEICREYVQHYVDAFPNICLLMRRPFSFVAENNIGLYNDMTGDVAATREWLDWQKNGGEYNNGGNVLTYTPIEKIWNVAPVGGEFTSGILPEKLYRENLRETEQLLKDSHMTFIGPKIPNLEEQKEYEAGIESIQSLLGYQYGVTHSKVRLDTFFDRMSVEITMKNYGVAPMYYDWPVCIYVIDEDGKIVIRKELEINLSELGMEESYTAETKFKCAKNMWSSLPTVAVVIENPYTGLPAVQLQMDGEHWGNIYYLIQ